jgi:hypothetical protein
VDHTRTPPYEIGEPVSAMHDCSQGRGRISTITPRPDGRWDATVIINTKPTPRTMTYIVSARGHSDFMDRAAHSPQVFNDDMPTLPELAELQAAIDGQENTTAPAFRLLPDGQIRIYEAEPDEDDPSRTYVIDLFGLSISIYLPAIGGTRIQVDQSDEGPAYTRPLMFEAFNEGTEICGHEFPENPTGEAPFDLTVRP